ncbi:unnamed protein product [Tilletia laevis]|uniref:Uncharacterized protein n=2 Tax=Tilletia TaxID=13289 RepID=A0A8X7MRG9_9BASI|nr:hypothetical protein CF336_g6714 [Tilletia laevis]KAE8191355.1 hypothetical protein CF328_g5704 [Tilletia controversa]KAE8248410.1 hypothetical protein A4X03_0g6782 [Tilletia caries]KAE8188919.1 hypothetical protein CF335_g6759 [Tilletia laevis]KAE8245285.1 hypothetical protein A4X06_0g5752 [Tilletia controversa]
MSEGTDTAERTNQTPDATLAEIAASLRRMESRIGGVENAFVDHQVRLSAIVNAYPMTASGPFHTPPPMSMGPNFGYIVGQTPGHVQFQQGPIPTYGMPWTVRGYGPPGSPPGPAHTLLQSGSVPQAGGPFGLTPPMAPVPLPMHVPIHNHGPQVPVRGRQSFGVSGFPLPPRQRLLDLGSPPPRHLNRDRADDRTSRHSP